MERTLPGPGTGVSLRPLDPDLNGRLGSVRWYEEGVWGHTGTKERSFRYDRSGAF